MFFLNRFYFYSNYIKKVLISSVLVFLFSYSVYSVGVPQSADRPAAYATLKAAEKTLREDNAAAVKAEAEFRVANQIAINLANIAKAARISPEAEAKAKTKAKAANKDVVTYNAKVRAAEGRKLSRSLRRRRVNR